MMASSGVVVVVGLELELWMAAWRILSRWVVVRWVRPERVRMLAVVVVVVVEGVERGRVVRTPMSAVERGGGKKVSSGFESKFQSLLRYG